MTQQQKRGAISLLSSGSPVHAYDPKKPEIHQRNRLIALGHDDGVCHEKLSRADVYYRQLGSSAFHQHRALICNGDRLLGWIGVLREDAPTVTERHIWASLIPYFVQALRLDSALRESSFATAGLAGTLDRLEGLWFVTAHTGRIVHSNAAAKYAMDAAAKDTQALVTAAIKMRESVPGASADVSELRDNGKVSGFLVQLRSPRSLEARLEFARQAWNITSRQLEALALIANGASNKDIAHSLGCALRTAEAHVTALLRGSKSSSRAELIAKVWTLR